MVLELATVQRRGADLCLVLSDRLVHALDLRENDHVAVDLRLLPAGGPRSPVAIPRTDSLDPFRREEALREAW